jgi:hypothetical protein
MNSVLGLVILFCLVFSFYKYHRPAQRPVWVFLFLMKIVFGVSLGLIYTYVYPIGDTWNFYHDAQVFAGHLTEESVFKDQPRALRFSEIVGIILIVFGNNYWLAGTVISFLSFLGGFYCITQLSNLSSSFRLPSIIAIFFVPSIAFWSSGVIKEAVVFPSLIILFTITYKWHKKQKPGLLDYMLLVVALACLVLVKYYLLGIFMISFLPVFAMELLDFLTIPKSTGRVLLITFLGAAFCYIIGPHIHPNFSINHLFPNLIASHKVGLEQTDNGLYISLKGLKAGWSSIIKSSPQAFFESIYRPYLWESRSLIQYLAAIENAVISLLSIFAIVTIRGMKWRLDWFVLSLILFIVLTGSLMAIGNPNLGTLSRLRVVYLSPLVFILVYLIKSNLKIKESVRLFQVNE